MSQYYCLTLVYVPKRNTWNVLLDLLIMINIIAGHNRWQRKHKKKHLSIYGEKRSNSTHNPNNSPRQGQGSKHKHEVWHSFQSGDGFEFTRSLVRTPQVIVYCFPHFLWISNNTNNNSSNTVEAVGFMAWPSILQNTLHYQ